VDPVDGEERERRSNATDSPLSLLLRFAVFSSLIEAALLEH